MMLRSILFCGVAVAVAAMAHPASSSPDCTCRANGEEVQEGQTICLRTASGMKLARCDMVLNNTSWTFLEQSCPTASLSRPVDPAVLQRAAL